MAIKKLAIIGMLLGASLLAHKGCSSSSKSETLPVEQRVYQELAQKQEAAKIDSQNQNQAIEQEREANISKFISDYQQHVKSAVDSFNKGIEDGVYTLDEQRTTLNEFKASAKDLEAVARLDTSRRHLEWYKDSKTSKINIVQIKDAQLKYTSGEKSLRHYLGKNLEDFDVGTPELEKSLRKQGLEVSVERTMKPEIKIPLALLGCFGVLCGITVISASPFLKLYAENKRLDRIQRSY